MLFNSPISREKADHLVNMLELPARAKVVEAGCGSGVLLTSILEKYDAFGLGIDLDPALVHAAQEHASSVLTAQQFEFKVGDIQQEKLEENSFDLALCMGSSHAYGMGESAYRNTLTEMGSALKPGGLLLIGEGYWQKAPTAKYLEFIGDPVGIYRDFCGNITLARELGFDPVYAAASTLDEWDDFEWSHKRKHLKQLELHPDDEQVKRRLARTDHWIEGYLKWGRGTMGFGLYLFRKV